MGKGSYGKVYSSYDKLLQQHVMVKRQPLQQSELVERELLSFQTLRAFPHPNVVRMLDYFTGSREDRSPATTGEPSCPVKTLRKLSALSKGDEFFYMVFEACASDLYAAYMRNPLGRAGCKPIPELSKHLLEIARGVAHLHGLGLVHGDLSMSNILVGGDNRARVADLGTAHSCHTLLAGSNALKGTYYARAPEIWMKAPLSTTASDAWSVGVAAFAMMSGCVPGVESLHGEEEADSLFEPWLRTWVDILGQPQREACPTLTRLAKWKDTESACGILVPEAASPNFGSSSRLAPLQRYFSARPTERPLGSEHALVRALSRLLHWEPTSRQPPADFCEALQPVCVALGADCDSAPLSSRSSHKPLQTASDESAPASLECPNSSGELPAVQERRGCQCRGNCGWSDCCKKKGDCKRPPLEGFLYCFRCKCDVRCCPRGRDTQKGDTFRGRYCREHRVAAEEGDDEKTFLQLRGTP